MLRFISQCCHSASLGKIGGKIDQPAMLAAKRLEDLHSKVNLRNTSDKLELTFAMPSHLDGLIDSNF